MADVVVLRREDWEKLNKYHEELGHLLFDTENFLYSLLQVNVSPHWLDPKALELHRRMEPLAKFLFVEPTPFGITAQGDVKP